MGIDTDTTQEDPAEDWPVWPDGERVSQITFDNLRHQLDDAHSALEEIERISGGYR